MEADAREAAPVVLAMRPTFAPLMALGDALAAEGGRAAEVARRFAAAREESRKRVLAAAKPVVERGAPS